MGSSMFMAAYILGTQTTITTGVLGSFDEGEICEFDFYITASDAGYIAPVPLSHNAITTDYNMVN